MTFHKLRKKLLGHSEKYARPVLFSEKKVMKQLFKRGVPHDLFRV